MTSSHTLAASGRAASDSIRAEEPRQVPGQSQLIFGLAGGESLRGPPMRSSGPFCDIWGLSALGPGLPIVTLPRHLVTSERHSAPYCDKVRRAHGAGMCACGAGVGKAICGWHGDTVAQMCVSIKWAGGLMRTQFRIGYRSHAGNHLWGCHGKRPHPDPRIEYGTGSLPRWGEGERGRGPYIPLVTCRSGYA